MARQVLERTGGRLDVLVNNASNFYPTPIGTITLEQWHDLFGSNLKAPLFLSQAVLPALRAARGVIINIVDVHSQRPLRDHPVYGAGEGRARDADALAREGSRAPTSASTACRPARSSGPTKECRTRCAPASSSKRRSSAAASPRTSPATVLFLVRDAPYITGQIIAVDGGRSVGW